MVWDSSQSALYNAVARHNENTAERPGRYAETADNSEGSSDAQQEIPMGGGSESAGGAFSDGFEESGAREEAFLRESVSNGEPHDHGGGRAECRSPRGKSSERIVPRDPISAILSDRDALLIAALILVLLHEKADIKLIAALAFILLG